MKEAIISGFVLGCALSLMIGPVFFMVIGTSIHDGFKQAATLAFGVVISDASFVILTGLGGQALFNNLYFKEYSGYVGGILLIVFGLVSIFGKKKINAELVEEVERKHRPLQFFAEGFFMNTLNPFVLIFWIGVATTVSAKEFLKDEMIAFYATALSIVFSIDLLKSYTANKLRRFLKPGLIVFLNRLAGIALILFGIRILCKVILG